MTLDPSLGGFRSPSGIPTEKGSADSPPFPPLPPPWTLVPNLPASPSRSWATPPALSPLLERGLRGRGLGAGAPVAVAPARFRRGGPRGCSFPSPPRRSVPPRLGLAPRALLGAPGPRPGPGRPPGTRPPTLRQAAGGPGLGVGTGRGSLCPTRASPLPQPSRFQGPRRRPLHGPCGPPPPGRAAPSDSRGRDHCPFPTITPTDSGTHPPGHQCQRRLPGPRTYLHGSTKPRSGGGESSALLCLSLALPEHIVSGIG